MPHAHPEWNLPADFARSFFRAQRVSYRGKSGVATTADIDAQISELQTQVIALQEQRAEAASREQKETEQAAKVAADEKALEEAQAQMAEWRNKSVALERKLGRRK